MDEEILKFILPLITGSAGVLLKSGYDTYKKKQDKKSKAEVMDKLYTDLERMYAKDLELQRQLHEKAMENAKLKQIILKWEGGNNGEEVQGR